MSDVIRVIQKDVQLGGITIDGLQLPDGRIGTSFASFGKTIGHGTQQVIQWLCGNSDEAVTARNLLTKECGFENSYFLGSSTNKRLQEAGLRIHILPEIRVEGVRGKARFIPDPHLLLPLYWRYWDGKGNVKAKALLVATSAEAIERRLDAAFGIQRTEQQRNETLKDRIARLLTEAGIPYGRAVPEPKYSEAMERRAYGAKTAQENWQLIDGVKWFCKPGTDTWQVDIDTPNYRDYCLWREWYPRYDLSLDQAIAALKLIKSEHLAA